MKTITINTMGILVKKIKKIWLGVGVSIEITLNNDISLLTMFLNVTKET